MAQLRKQRCKNGLRESKMISFRADQETIWVLNQISNKGRFINEIIQKVRPEELLKWRDLEE